MPDSESRPPDVLTGNSPPIARRPSATERAALPVRREPVRFECHQHGDREAVVDLRDVDVLRAQSRHLQRGCA